MLFPFFFLFKVAVDLVCSIWLAIALFQSKPIKLAKCVVILVLFWVVPTWIYLKEFDGRCAAGLKHHYRCSFWDYIYKGGEFIVPGVLFDLALLTLICSGLVLLRSFLRRRTQLRAHLSS